MPLSLVFIDTNELLSRAKILMKAVTDHQTLLDLEFDKVLEWCSQYALSETTKSRISKLVPISNYDSIKEQLNQIDELKNIKAGEKGFPALEFENLESELRLLKIKNAVIPLSGILNIHQASYLVNQILSFFENSIGSYPTLADVLKDSYQTLDIISPIEKVIDKAGQIKDTASPELKDIRDAIRRTQKQLKKNFWRAGQNFEDGLLVLEKQNHFERHQHILHEK